MKTEKYMVYNPWDDKYVFFKKLDNAKEYLNVLVDTYIDKNGNISKVCNSCIYTLTHEIDFKINFKKDCTNKKWEDIGCPENWEYFYETKIKEL